jgi:hypothetical protein
MPENWKTIIVVPMLKGGGQRRNRLEFIQTNIVGKFSGQAVGKNDH